MTGDDVGVGGTVGGGSVGGGSVGSVGAVLPGPSVVVVVATGPLVAGASVGASVDPAVVLDGALVVPTVVVRPEMFGVSANAGETPPSATLEITGTATALAASATFTTFRRDRSTGSSGDWLPSSLCERMTSPRNCDSVLSAYARRGAAHQGLRRFSWPESRRGLGRCRCCRSRRRHRCSGRRNWRRRRRRRRNRCWSPSRSGGCARRLRRGADGGRLP